MDKKRKIQFHIYYMKIAEETAKLSYAQRNKVGSILVKGNSIIAQGFNGTPTKFDNTCEEITEFNEYVTKKEVIHSELNCITKCAKLGVSTKNSILYVTLSPCINCALLIIQSGIVQVIYKEKYRDEDGIFLLKKAGIKINSISELINEM